MEVIDNRALQNLGWDVSWQVEQVKQEFLQVAFEQQRPCVLLRPRLYPDGNMWCALYGEDLQNGLSGFGETPSKAMHDFDNNYYGHKKKE